LDWIALGLIALTGLIGLRKGLVASGLAIVGVVAGAVLGARVAPLCCRAGRTRRTRRSSRSPAR
jgi:uncharacterized membrane protein required for colicin V production